MFTARNTIVAAGALLVAVVGFAMIRLMGVPDSDGLAVDTYGTRWHGFRAVFELLAELGAPAKRELGPPGTSFPLRTTFVVLVPDGLTVTNEPAYLERLRPWIEQGGRVVIAPVFEVVENEHVAEAKVPKRIDPLLELGLTGVRVEQDRPQIAEHEDAKAKVERTARERQARIATGIKKTWEERWSPSQRKYVTAAIKASGKLPFDAARLKRLQLPEEGHRRLELASPDLATGLLKTVVSKGEPRILLASFRRGQGEIVVLAEPGMLMNACLGHDDNAICAYELLAGDGRSVVFDEFYHGLLVRGQPLWLFTKARFAVAAVAGLVLVLLAAWRKALFLGPPLTTLPPSRRTVLEYIDAMARFFARARDSQTFVVAEMRAGVLQTLGERLGLGPAQATPESIGKALVKRSPKSAEQLLGAMRELDVVEGRGARASRADTLRALQAAARCLSLASPGLKT